MTDSSAVAFEVLAANALAEIAVTLSGITTSYGLPPIFPAPVDESPLSTVPSISKSPISLSVTISADNAEDFCTGSAKIPTARQTAAATENSDKNNFLVKLVIKVSLRIFLRLENA